MKMPHADESLRERIRRGGSLPERMLSSPRHRIPLDQLVSRTGLDCRLSELAACAAVITTASQLVAAIAAVSLDGVARRLVLCPPDLSPEHFAPVIEAADADVLVTDKAELPPGAARVRRVACSASLGSQGEVPGSRCRTEWVLLTSGTTGAPKLAAHTLDSLTGAIKPGGAATSPRPVWGTFYDIRRYGGLQILLRALLGSGSLVVSDPDETTADFLGRAGRASITHISGTPSHWRRALMSGAAGRIAPRYVRLSGEIVDQAILDDLRVAYPDASVGHAFASTEAGVAFEVNDGLAGFPARLVDAGAGEVELKVEDGSLHTRSPRTASRYLGARDEKLRSDDGFVDTGDIVERIDDRYYFVGRRGGIINVGGLKVHPEEVEAVVNRHPAVQMSLVKARRNPFTGSVIVADIVVRPEWGGTGNEREIHNDIIELCRQALPRHKVPAAIHSVPALNVGAAGKLARLSA